MKNAYRITFLSPHCPRRKAKPRDQQLPADNQMQPTTRRFSSLLLALALCGGAPALSRGAEVAAFPGAEGGGVNAGGGRGGDVVYVTNLEDSGPGSLRDAVSKPHRTVVFAVSGTITLKDTLLVNQSRITIAGQTAPGDGICLRGKGLMITADDCIVRFLRIRPGDLLDEEHDALTVWGARNVIVDHCSMSWSTDSVADVVKKSGNVTVQWSIISEPLRKSTHSKGSHGYGTGWDGSDGAGSYHHNLLAHCDSRSPRIEKVGQNTLVDIRNMVIYNVGNGFAYGGERARFNYVANYVKPGPSTARPRSLFRISSDRSRGYFAGNFIEGFPEGSQDNARAVDIDDDLDGKKILVEKPFDVPPINTQSAKEASVLVLQHAGATLPARDAVDQRIVADVRHGTGKIIDSQRQVGGWPELKSVPAPTDSDQDGMPDDWERAHRLDPEDPEDGKRADRNGYTNLENYLNDLASRAWPKGHPTSRATPRP
jgi:pectate lyase